MWRLWQTTTHSYVFLIKSFVGRCSYTLINVNLWVQHFFFLSTNLKKRLNVLFNMGGGAKKTSPQWIQLAFLHKKWQGSEKFDWSCRASVPLSVQMLFPHNFHQISSSECNFHLAFLHFLCYSSFHKYDRAKKMMYCSWRFPFLTDVKSSPCVWLEYLSHAEPPLTPRPHPPAQTEIRFSQITIRMDG